MFYSLKLFSHLTKLSHNKIDSRSKHVCHGSRWQTWALTGCWAWKAVISNSALEQCKGSSGQKDAAAPHERQGPFTAANLVASLIVTMLTSALLGDTLHSWLVYFLKLKWDTKNWEAYKVSVCPFQVCSLEICHRARSVLSEALGSLLPASGCS